MLKSIAHSWPLANYPSPLFLLPGLPARHLSLNFRLSCGIIYR